MKRLLVDNPNTVAHWDGVYSDNPFLELDRLRYQTLAQYIEDKPCKVLDLGCGNGQGCWVIKLARPQSEVSGVDFHNQTQSHNYGTFIQADVSDTKLEPGFDYVTCSETLEHVDYPPILINEIYRLLNKGGVALLTTPYLDHTPSGEHVWEFDYPDVEAMFAKAGFSKVWVFPWAGQRMVYDTNGSIIYPTGNWDTIFCIGVK